MLWQYVYSTLLVALVAHDEERREALERDFVERDRGPDGFARAVLIRCYAGRGT